ncbi:MAG: hypothetical protein CL609_07015 [Anaerolineaceae bacterium]|nr:hypothetical protein [Anaerolineaceae bacterium]
MRILKFDILLNNLKTRWLNMEYDLLPCTFITVDAIGKPGQRVFYIQGKTEDTTLTLLIEKIQIQTLAAGILRFLEELIERNPDMSKPSGQYNEDQMKITPPVDPLFRVGEIGLAYDIDRDLACLIAKEIQLEAETEDEKQQDEVRYWCTREQLKSLAIWGLDLVQKGRPICPLCGEPINPDGHFCPKKKWTQ